MRTISPAQVNSIRGVVVWVLRSAAVILLMMGAYFVLKKVMFGVGTAQPDMILDVYEGVGESHSTYRGLALLAVGIALGAPSRRLSRWIVAVPPDECPGCGYEPDRSAATGRCPECGLPGVGGVGVPGPILGTAPAGSSPS